MLDNRLAEMATGEGKTLAAALAAATAALAGMPVHVVTSNDYLVDRDAEHLGPVYRDAGSDRGSGDAPAGPGQRRAAYGSDIAYCTAKELTFDYLRDRLVRRHLAQRAARPRAPSGKRPGRVDRPVAARAVDGAGGRGRQHSDRRGAHAADPVAAADQPAAAGLRAGSAAHRPASGRGTRFSSRPVDPAGRADRRRPRPAGAAGQRRWAGCGRTAGIATRSCPWRWWPIICCSATSTTWCASARS